MSKSISKSKSSKQASKNPKTKSSSRKERLAQKRKTREARQKMIGVILSCLTIGSLLGIPLGFAISLKAGLGAALGTSCLLFSIQYPRQALWAFLVYMPFSGTVTYWIGGGNPLFQLSKDAFYFPALLALIQDCRKKRQPIFVAKPLMLTLVLLVILCLMTFLFVNTTQQFLPFCDDLADRTLRDANGVVLLDPRTNKPLGVPCKEGIPFLQGLLGLKILLGYIPLIFCAYYLIEDKKRLFWLGRILVTVAIVCMILGLAQYWMLKTGRCEGTRGLVGINLFRPDLNAKCLVGGSLLYSPSQNQIRLPGTFVSPWHWSWFLIASAAISVVVALNDQRFFWRIFGYVGMALAFVNGIICGQRAAFLMVPGIMVFSILLSSLLSGRLTSLRRLISIMASVLFSLLLILLILRFINPDFIQQRIDSFVSRWQTAPPQKFLVDQLAFSLEQQKSILGLGLGRATNATRAFGDITLVETFHAKIIFEIGLLGLIAFLAFVLHIAFLTFRAFRSLRDPILNSFGASFWAFIFIISLYPQWYPLDTDPVAVYYWFFIGVVLRLVEIERQELKAKQLQDSQLPETNHSRKSLKTRVRHRKFMNN